MLSILIGIHSNNFEPVDFTEKNFDKKTFFDNLFFNIRFRFNMHFQNFKFSTHSSLLTAKPDLSHALWSVIADYHPKTQLLESL